MKTHNTWIMIIGIALFVSFGHSTIAYGMNEDTEENRLQRQRHILDSFTQEDTVDSILGPLEDTENERLMNRDTENNVSPVHSAIMNAILDNNPCMARALIQAGAIQPIQSVAISGDRVITGSEDRSVRIWDLTTGQLVHTLPVTPVTIFENRVNTWQRSHNQFTTATNINQEHKNSPIPTTIIIIPQKEADCGICMDTTQCNIIPCCQTTFCTDCLMENLEACLYKNSTQEILCPNKDCSDRQINEATIRIITWGNKRQDLYQRYLEIALHNCLDQDQAIKQCPTTNCDNRIITDSENNRRLAYCQGCNREYCSHCLFYHSNNTCTQAAEDREIAQNPTLVEQANQEWIANNTKKCPQCLHGIQKDGGCNHMTCKKCKYEFCWTCLAEYGTTLCNSARCHAPVNNRTNSCHIQ